LAVIDSAAAPPSALRQRLVSGSQFVTVGLLGLAVNQLLMWMLVDGLHVQYVLAAGLATQGSTTFNFLGAESWVFRARRVGGLRRTVVRFVAYDALNSATLIVRLPLLYVLVSGLHIHYLVANLASLCALTLLRYVVADWLIWSARALRGRTAV